MMVGGSQEVLSHLLSFRVCFFTTFDIGELIDSVF